MSGRLRELTDVSPDIAWKLVDKLFQQTGSLAIGGIILAFLGALGFAGTGSFWYLGGMVLSGGICAGRVWQNHVYAHSRGSASPAIWARRCLVSAWTMSAGWGLWSMVMVFEQDKVLATVVLSTLSSNVIGAAIRSCTVPFIARGQILLTLVPLTVGCLFSGNMYVVFSAGASVLHIVAAFALTRFLHQQTLRLLMQDEEKTSLVNSLEVARRELEGINQHLETLATIDGLTGVANRRAFDLVSSREWQRAMRERTPLSMLMVDVDHFKAYNDHHGHQAGDACLREIAATIASAVRRPGDVVARYGGEEFAVILPDTELGGALTMANTLLRAVAARDMRHDASPFGHVTISIGAACMTPRRGENDTAPLTALADAALYTAKRGGRDRVHAAEMPAEAVSTA